MPISRPLKWIFGIVAALVLSALAFVLLMAWFFESFLGNPGKDEVARVVSPSGKVDAVLFETNGGATTSFGYLVHVVQHGAPVSGSPAVSLYGAVRNEHAYGANLVWASSDRLEIQFLSAKSAEVNTGTLSAGGETIRIALREGINDREAPPGGMLYNRQGHR